MRAEVRDAGLTALIDLVEGVAAHMLEANIDDRLAGSTPFLTMVSVAVCGWLLERQMRIAATQDSAFHKAKVAVASYYLGHIVPEALGLAASARAGAAGLYILNAEEMAA